jgi:hypothetical protein
VFRLADLVKPDLDIRSVEVRCPEHGTLPLYAFPCIPGGLFLDDESVQSLLRVPRPVVTLGPFPATEIEVLVTDAAGATRTHRVRAE